MQRRHDPDEENNGGIKCTMRTNPGLAITWGPNFFGAVKSPEEMRGGELGIEERSVPYFLYNLGKQLGNFDFLGNKILDGIRKAKEVWPEKADYKAIQEDAEAYNKIMMEKWAQKCAFMEKPYAIFERKDSEKADELERIMKVFWNSKIVPGNLETVGFVPNVLKDDVNVIMLKPKASPKDTCIYIAQVSRPAGEVNMVKADEYILIRLVKDIIANCGVDVAGALRPLVNKEGTAVAKEKSPSHS
ncbi:MAG: hypothetical protein KGH66_02925 [Candidatus Micrarchaeota archaeon]|nr:hypothetical protein [Candidatus Micrarchaeota archaeon]